MQTRTTPNADTFHVVSELKTSNETKLVTKKKEPINLMTTMLKALSSNKRTYIRSTFQNYRLQNKLHEELRQEMDIIVNIIIWTFLSYEHMDKVIWNKHVHNHSKIIINWYLLPLYVMFSTTVYHLQRNKTGTEFLTLWSCHRLPYKN